MSKDKVCDICGKRFDEYGNNPAPFKGERCCDKCNANIVIPMRIYGVIKDPTSAVLFQTDGTVRTVEPKDKYFTLKELQTLVGGLIELYLKRIHNNLIVCNEEGILLNLDVNSIFKKYTDITLVGVVLMCRETGFPNFPLIFPNLPKVGIN